MVSAVKTALRFAVAEDVCHYLGDLFVQKLSFLCLSGAFPVFFLHNFV